MARSALFAAVLAGCVVPALGCKTGTSFAKPSWWTFGGAPKNADALASAPPYGGDIKKPSELSKPYPTTSTPSGYVITGSTSPADTAAQQIRAAQPETPVVYGSTPLPQSAPAATASSLAAAPPAAAQPAPASIAPQVGPYAALAGESIPPPGQPLPPIAPSTMPTMANMPSTPSEAMQPNAPYSSFSAPAASPAAIEPPAPRMADARAADPAAAIPAAALPAAAAAYGGSRYSTNTGSRFSGAEAASFSPPATGMLPGSAYGSPAETALPAAAPQVGPLTAPPAAVPATPGLLQPSAQPVRRPDPGYRPGGTSSYRPSRTILADDSAPPAAAVRTASYEESPAGTIQQ